jgi:hypothetical protein
MSTPILWSDQASAQYAKLRAYALAAVGSQRDRGATSPQMTSFKSLLHCIEHLAACASSTDLQTNEITGMANPYDANRKIFEAHAHSADACRIIWCHGPSKDQITLLTITPHLSHNV